jgi:hypothetical protein
MSWLRDILASSKPAPKSRAGLRAGQESAVNANRQARRLLSHQVAGRNAAPYIASANARKQSRKTDTPPVSPRISVDGGSKYSMMFDRFAGGLSGLAAKFPFEFYEVLDHFFMVEPYFQRFLHQTISLANTGHKLEIDAGTEAQAQEAIQAANDLAARCYPWGGGADGIVSGGISQLCRPGAMCVEWVPTADLSQIAQAYFVPIRTCRFRRLPDGNLELCQLQDGNLVPLNPVQTSFYALDLWDDNPYPIPPTIAAMRALTKLAKFDDSIDGWLSKLSGLGLLIGQLEVPERLPDEWDNEEKYQLRVKTYLADFVKSVTANLKSGFVASFKNVEFDHKNTSAGASGAKEILQMVLQGLFAGLGRDPVFFGWSSFGATETYSKVMFEELINSIHRYQLGAKRTMEHGHRLNFALGGLGDVGVSLSFNENRSLDSFMGSEAKQMEATAVVQQYEAQLIDRDEARQMLGIQEKTAAKSNAFVASFNRLENRYVLQAHKRRTWNGNGDGRLESPPHNYGERRRVIALNADTKTVTKRDAKNAAKQYYKDVKGVLSAAGATGADAVHQWAMGQDIPDPELLTEAEAELFADEALQQYIDAAEGSMDPAGIAAFSRDAIETIWAFGKIDPDLGWARVATEVPSIAFGQHDRAAVSYLTEKVDKFYISKYVSNSPVRSRQITNFISDYYIKGGFGSGRGTDAYAAFRDKFGDLTQKLGDHATRIMVDTAVSRAQNWSNILTLSELDITEFKIAGPDDRLCCRYCRSMLGRVFKVETEMRRINNIIASGDEDIAKFSPFITSRYGTNEGYAALKASTDEQVQQSGMAAPPFHCLCRHRIVAEFKTVSNSRSNSRILRLPVISSEWRKAA